MKTDGFEFDLREVENGKSVATVDGVKVELQKGDCSKCFFNEVGVCPRECYTEKCWVKK